MSENKELNVEIFKRQVEYSLNDLLTLEGLENQIAELDDEASQLERQRLMLNTMKELLNEFQQQSRSRWKGMTPREKAEERRRMASSGLEVEFEQEEEDHGI